MLDKSSSKIEEKLKRIPAKYYWLVAGILSIVTYFFVFSISNMMPYGKGTVIRLDMYAQYVSCSEYLMEVLKGNHGYWFSWSNFCGFNNSGMFAYLCMSPFNLLFLVFGKNHIVLALTLIVLLKAGTAAALMQRFLMYFLRNKRISTVIFAVAYSLCGYQIAYYCVMNFTDAVYILPLIMLAITKLFREGKVLPLIGSYFLLFFSCFYMGYMIGIGSFILGLCYYVYSLKKRNFSNNILAVLKYIYSVFTAILLTAVIWLPALIQIFTSAEEDYNDPNMWKTNIVLILNNLFVGEYQNLRGYTPYVYCGLITFILAFSYFFNKRIKVRERIYAISVTLIVVLLMCVPFLNRLMHAFDTPQMFGYRFSFVFSFVLCVIACRQSVYYQRIEKRMIGLFSFFAVCIFVSSISLYIYRDGVNGSNKVYVAAINAAFIAIWFALFKLGKSRKFEKFTYNVLVIAVLIAELALNGAVVYGRSADLNFGSDEFKNARIARANTLDKIEFPKENEFYRAQMITDIGPNAGLEDGFYSLTSFSSTAPGDMLKAIRKLGMAVRMHATPAKGMTPFLRSVMGVKYYSNYDLEVVDGLSWNEYEKNNSVITILHDEGKHGSSIVKENERFLSLGFMVDEDILNIELTDSPFDNQNSIASKMCGTDIKMYDEVSWDWESEKGTLEEFTRGKSKEYDELTSDLSMNKGYLFFVRPEYIREHDSEITSEDYLSADAVIFRFFTEDNGKPIYGYFGRKLEYSSDSIIVSVDETDILENSGTSHKMSEPYINMLGHNEVGEYEENVVLPVGIKKDYCENIIFTEYNEDEYIKAYDILSRNQLQIDTFKDGYVQGEIEAKKAGVMFTSIPYINGWKVYVDGVEVEPIALIEGAFLGVPMDAGEHQIEMKYTAPGAVCGGILSGVGLLLLIVAIILGSNKRFEEKLACIQFAPIKIRNRKKKLPLFVFFAVISFIIITICSENSFLYPFNTEVDISAFYTVARSMLNGKVLYRDIYEHKGVYLYFIYALAHMMVPGSYRGIYLIEILNTWVFTVFSYKTAFIISKKEKISAGAAIIAALVSCTFPGFQEGGFAEEFTVSILAVCVWMAVKYFSQIFPEKIPFKYCFGMGILFAILFWIKYTVLGIALALGIYLIVVFIKSKHVKRIFSALLQLVLGFGVGTIPAALYFVCTDSINDMFKVYFYNMLFVYGDSYPIPAGERLVSAWIGGGSTVFILMSSALLALFVISLILYKQIEVKKEVKEVIIALFVGTFIFTSYGLLFTDPYQAFVFAPFIIFPVLLIYLLINRISLKKTIEDLKNIQLFMKNYLLYFAIGIGAIAIVLYEIKAIKSPYVVILTLLYLKLLNAASVYICDKSHFEKIVDKRAVRYVVPLGVCVISEIICQYYDYTNVPGIASVVLIFYYLLEDILEYGEEIASAIKKKTVWINNLYRKLGFRVSTCLAVFIASLVLGNSTGYMFTPISDVPQYKMSRIIAESNIENPIIYHYYFLDSGVFNLLDKYPQMKYFGFYNIDLPEVNETMKKYVENGEADFIITRQFIDSLEEKYELVYFGNDYYTSGNPCFCLYKKK